MASKFLAPGALAVLALLGSACSRSDPEPQRDPSAGKPPVPSALPAAASSPPAPIPTATATSTLAPSSPLVLARGVRIVRAPTGDVAKVVKTERERAKNDGRDLVVYVGAVWCEPCRYFHKAAEAGKLDDEFPNLTLLEFDLDEDRERLATDGYTSSYIPLFAMPSADGRASGKKFEGAVKGDGAVAHIAPRLRSLIASAK